MEKAFFIILTNKCNYSCKHCYNELDTLKNKTKETNILTIDILKKLFISLYNQGYKKVLLSGGEPTLRKDLMDIIKEGKKAGLIVALFTNGERLNSSYISSLENVGLDELRISLNELVWTKKKSEYLEIINKKTFFLKESIETKISIGYIYILSANNITFATKAMNYLKKLGASMKIQPLYLPYDLSKQNNTVSISSITNKEWNSLIDKLNNEVLKEYTKEATSVYGSTLKDYKYTQFIQNILKNNTKPSYCPTGPLLVIDSDGDIHPCLFRYDITINNVCNINYNIDEIDNDLKKYSFLKNAMCFKEECLSAFR